ncbi:MAG: hypothetical protein AB7O97_03700 [Planctomycetota bacterium]
MLKRSVFVAATLAAGLSAQCVPPVPSLTTVFQGNVVPVGIDPVLGANVYFDLELDQALSLTAVHVNLQNPLHVGQLGQVDLWARVPFPSSAVGQHQVGSGGTVPATPPGWTLLGTANVLVQAADAQSLATFAVPIPLPAATYGMALGFRQVAGAPLVPFATDPSLLPVPTVHANEFLRLTAIGTQAAAWTGALQPFVPNLRIDYQPQPNSAYSTGYGFGCIAGSTTAAHMQLRDRPVIGRPLVIDITDVDPSVGASLLLFSTTSLGGVDLSVIGMNGCSAFITVPEILSFLSFGPGPYAVQAVPAIPASLANIDLFIQTVLFSTATPPWNPANLLVSDAVCIHYAVN